MQTYGLRTFLDKDMRQTRCAGRQMRASQSMLCCAGDAFEGLRFQTADEC